MQRNVHRRPLSSHILMGDRFWCNGFNQHSDGGWKSLSPSYPGPKTDFSRINSKENFMERLPSEVLIKILSYLDVSSLFCIGHVSRLFRQLANDDILWQKIYLSEFGGWKPKSVNDVVVMDDPREVEKQSTGRWKMMYLRNMAEHGTKMWRKYLRDISPYTALPRQTERVLRNLNVSWELTLCNNWGQRSTLEQSRVYFFESSVIVRWNGGSFLKYHHISSIQLYGVRKEAPKSPEARKPRWRSLMLKVDTKTCPQSFIGNDGLIKAFLLPPGVIIGIWRGQNSVAFIMVSLHFHRLVEKSVLGSPTCPYAEPVDLLPAGDSDPELGLHGYSLHFVLHNTSTEIMSRYFGQLSSRIVQIERRLVELRVINRTNLSQHRSLSGSIKLPWKSEDLEGAIENCCIMTLTLLDEFQKPFWCVSSPVCITMTKKVLSRDYKGDHFLMEYQNPDGEVKMMLVWLKEQKQFFLFSLTVYVTVANVNKRFSREY
ncbi:F-box only protein 15-like isoform X2 [Melanotaenia boesemani]|uniref:F-box only protein 15-like isoform X2 n=1 Tax=Melanotaenia boesemani TaxID=1250792 RepID=UPI001C04A2A8|nr:F-box only protein 15-like isoform X2 [Melanotaenia boesemani]